MLIWEGKAKPVGLPVPAEKERSPPHWMPTSRTNWVLASTMRASMSTCGVSASRLRTRPSALIRFSSTSLTIRTLVRLSTVTVPRSERMSLT